MKRIYIPLFALLLAVAAQPVLVASAAELFVRQDKGTEESKSIGKPTLYNKSDSSKGYSMPFKSSTQKFVSTAKKQYEYVKGNLPSSWKTLNQMMINNRLKDTNNAIKLAAKNEKKMLKELKYGAKNKKLAQLEKKHQAFIESLQEVTEGKGKSKKSNKKVFVKRSKDKGTVGSRKVFNTPEN